MTSHDEDELPEHVKDAIHQVVQPNDARKNPSVLAARLASNIPNRTPLEVVLKALEMMLVEVVTRRYEGLTEQTRGLAMSFGSAINSIKMAAVLKPKLEAFRATEGREPRPDEIQMMLREVLGHGGSNGPTINVSPDAGGGIPVGNGNGHA
jgi:hypothetical protein